MFAFLQTFKPKTLTFKIGICFIDCDIVNIEIDHNVSFDVSVFVTDISTADNSFVCLAVTCQPPVDIPNGMRLSNRSIYHYQDFVSYRCNFGFHFTADSNSTLRCDVNGSWHSYPPVCEGR